jgi:DNA-binding transcriptional regulator YiaG
LLVIPTIVVATMGAVEFKKLRQSVKLSQSMLARELDLYVRTISRYETGELEIPRVTELALRYIVQQTKQKRRR